MPPFRIYATKKRHLRYSFYSCTFCIFYSSCIFWKGALGAAAALSLRKIDGDGDAAGEGYLVMKGPPEVRIQLGSMLSTIGMSAVVAWLFAKSKSSFSWLLFCIGTASVPFALESAGRVKRRAPALRSWLYWELKELAPTLSQKKPDVLGRFRHTIVQRWETEGLAEETSIKEVVGFVQNSGTKVMIQSLLNGFMPGSGGAFAEPLAQVLEPTAREAVVSVIRQLNPDTLVTALRAANVDLSGDANGPDGIMGLTVSRDNCLNVLEAKLIEPAFDSAVVGVQKLADNPQEVERILKSLGGTPQLFWNRVQSQVGAFSCE